MPVFCDQVGRDMTATVSGEVDHHGAKEIMQSLDHNLTCAMPHSLTLDLSGVTFMDSSGIAVLLRTWRRMGELQGRMQVVGVPPQPARVLKAAGIDRLIPFA